jgi:hypothetical protein
MMQLFLNDEEQSVLIGALYTANEKYRECAKVMRNEPNHERIAAQFEIQIQQVSDLLEKIEE